MARRSIVSGNGWFRVYAPCHPVSLRLVCFPYAGGGASVFQSWPGLLPPTFEVIAVQYPGRQDRYDEEFVTDMGTLADAIAPAVASLPSCPMAFFGHSLGATIAFEVAIRLHPRFPTPLAHLFVSARKAPAACTPVGVASLTDEALWDYARSLRGAGTPVLDPSLERELRLSAAPVLRSDLMLSESYAYQAGTQVSCPVTALAGADDHTVTLNDARRWAEYTTGPFQARQLPGSHFYLEERPADLTSLIAATAAADGTGSQPGRKDTPGPFAAR
jgi:surfactin synthase thioesterase subunit